MEFSMHDVREVREVYSDNDANSFIANGWVLLSAGFDSGSASGEHDSHQVYILGRTKD